MNYVEFKENKPVVGEYDIIVAGGGVSGVAAALSIETGKPIYDIDVSELQSRLEEANVMIHFDDSLVHQNKTIEKVDVGEI